MNKLSNCLVILLVLCAVDVTAQNTFPATGNVGIGTTSPGYKLEVNGTLGLDGALTTNRNTIYLAGPGDLNHAIGNLLETYKGTSDGETFDFWNFLDFYNRINGRSALFIDGSSGNVGIGTTSPNALLSLEKEGIDPTTYDMLRFNTGYGPIQWGVTGNTANHWGTTFYSWQPDASNNGSNLAFATGNGTTVNPNSNIRMLITSGGNVGIGTTTPRSTLDINGNVTFSDGSVQSVAWNGTTLGGDYAESIDVLGDRAGYEPGDVIVIDDSVTGKFNKSDKSYSKLVAGVYSTKPGLLGRRVTADRPDKAAEVPMAMMGIVPTKVTTENGAIERGDLLVSSSTPGYAMKGTDRDRLTGAVIGKALAPLKAGSGVVEVLLALQ